MRPINQHQSVAYEVWSWIGGVDKKENVNPLRIKAASVILAAFLVDK